MLIRLNTSRASVAAKAAGIVLLCSGVLVFSKECSSGAVKGINLCLTVLVPSLFPFMAIASFIVKSGLHKKFGRYMSGMARLLFGLDGEFAPVILLGMIGGYPVGAKGISELDKNGADEKQSKRAALFSVCAGPGFLINYTGMSLYQNKGIGVVILVAQIMSVIITGFFSRFVKTDKKKSNISDKEIKKISTPLSTAVVEAVTDSSKSMLGICAFVVLFSSFIGIAENIILNSTVKSIVISVTEVCTAVNLLSENGSIEAVAFAIGFGGLCVHFQIYSALGKLKVPKLLFFLFRIMQGALTAIITHFGLMLLPDTVPTFSTGTVEEFSFCGGTMLSGAVLIGVVLCFLYSLKNQKQN